MSNKLEKFKRAEEEKLEARNLEENEFTSALRAGEMFGAIRFADRLSRSLTAQTIRGLEVIQKDGGFRAYGYETFDKFLDEYEHSPMKKSKYYELKKILDAEGEDTFNLLNSLNIAVSTRKLIAQNGDVPITIEGDEVLIGEHRADLSDMPLIKELVKKLAVSNEKFAENRSANEKEIKRLKEKLETGEAEFSELRRQLDSLQEGDPHDKAVMRVMNAFLKLGEEVSQMPFAQKDQKAPQVLQMIWTQLQILRRSYHCDDFIFEDFAAASANGNGKVSDFVRDAVIEGGDFEDEDDE